MKHKLQPDESRWITITTVALVITASFVIFRIGVPDRWLAAIYCTVPTFAGMNAYFRDRWLSWRFRATLSLALLFHVLLIWLLFAVVLRHTYDVSLFVCLPFIFLEGFGLYHLVRATGEPQLLRTDERPRVPLISITRLQGQEGGNHDADMYSIPGAS